MLSKYHLELYYMSDCTTPKRKYSRRVTCRMCVTCRINSWLWPESTTECQRFRAYLRRLKFLNPVDVRTVCQSLGEEYELSEHLKNFTYLAKLARRKFIDEVFINKSRPPLFRPIPITKKEKKVKKIWAKRKFCWKSEHSSNNSVKMSRRNILD